MELLSIKSDIGRHCQLVIGDIRTWTTRTRAACRIGTWREEGKKEGGIKGRQHGLGVLGLGSWRFGDLARAVKACRIVLRMA
jgi:hypothetical protein